MRKKKGQALVEAALVIPLLLMFLCGIIDVGRILYAQSRLNLICQESVRMAGLGKGDAAIKSYAIGKLDGATVDNVVISPTESFRRAGDYVTVTLKYDVKYITPLVNVVIRTPFKAVAESTIRVE